MMLAALVSTCVARADTVLLIVAEDAAGRHAGLLAEWRSQVEREGWTVVEETVPRCHWRDPNRPGLAREIMRMAERTEPKAVFLFGAVARPATGAFRPDGHPPRCMWNDFPYSGVLPADAWTDNLDHGVESSLEFYRNEPGDGRWDPSIAVRGARWAVGRVDFSDMPELPRGRVPAGRYRAGEPRIPAVDEHRALADYLRRDLEWRKGQWRPERKGVIFEGVASPERLEALRRNRPEIEWVTVATFEGSPWAGRHVYAYASGGQDYRFQYHLGTEERGMIRGVWFSNLRSYEFEPIWVGGNQQGDMGNRYWLQWFLLVTWGFPDPQWMQGATAADGYLAYLGTPGRRGMHHHLDGDPTLPLAQRTGPRPRAPRNVRTIPTSPPSPSRPRPAAADGLAR